MGAFRSRSTCVEVLISVCALLIALLGAVCRSIECVLAVFSTSKSFFDSTFSFLLRMDFFDGILQRIFCAVVICAVQLFLLP